MVVASLLTTAGGAVALASTPDPASGPPSVAEQEKGMKTGLPFRDPETAVVDAGAGVVAVVSTSDCVCAATVPRNGSTCTSA